LFFFHSILFETKYGSLESNALQPVSLKFIQPDSSFAEDSHPHLRTARKITPHILVPRAKMDPLVASRVSDKEQSGVSPNGVPATDYRRVSSLPLLHEIILQLDRLEGSGNFVRYGNVPAHFHGKRLESSEVRVLKGFEKKRWPDAVVPGRSLASDRTEKKRRHVWLLG
jgi:hypothetical protein